jgi:hypothetical protein
MTQPRELTDEDLARVRSRFNDLAMQWRSLAPGSTLQLAFL